MCDSRKKLQFGHEISVRFEFPTINNQDEYETVIVEIKLVGEWGPNALSYEQNPSWLFPK